MRRLLAVLLLLLATSVMEAQQQATFRSSAHLIVSTVSVKDKNGKPIEGLTAKDFVITEEGKAQEIAFVEFQKLDGVPEPKLNSPAIVSTVDPVTQPLVSAPLPGDQKFRGRRLLVLYIDLYNMPFFDQLRVYENAAKYIDSQMTPVDLLSIMAFDSGRVRVKQEFTDDRALLGKVIQDMTTAAEDKNENRGIVEVGSAFGEDDDTFNLFATDRQLAALQTTVTGLGPLPELKTLIYLGSGLRLSGADNMAQLRATVNAAVRSNVTINPIDTRGLTAEPPMGDATRASRGGIGMFSGSIVQAATTRQQQSQDSYYALAKDTGGRAMFDNNDLSMGIVQAANAVTGYYMIGYYTSNTSTDGRYRRVKVSLAGNADAELSYRPGYYGEKDYSKFNETDRERQLEEALKAEDPITDIPMAMEINYFQISGAEYFVPISVRMPGGELTRPRPTGDTRAVIDMIGEIKDEYGVTLRNSKDKLQFKLDAATAADVARRPLQYETGFSLLPGNYTIKVLARDTTTGRIGTFIKSFVVPNLEREKVRLPVSTLVITSQRVTPADALYTVQQKISADVANPLVYGGQKLIPGVTRTLNANREWYIFMQAYERDSTSVRPLVAVVAFYRSGVKVLEMEPVGADSWDPKTRAVPIRITVPADTLSSGDYDCQVTVLDPSGGKAAFARSALQIK